MELNKAITKALKFCARGKDAPEVLNQIRFHSDGWVHATDGMVGVVIRSDLPIPDLVLDTSTASLMGKYIISAVKVNDKGDVLFGTLEGGSYAFGHKTDTSFPPIPTWPSQLKEVPSWTDVQKTFHASLKVGQLIEGVRREDLECVHFDEDRVEATDSYRMSVVDVSTGIKGKIPSKVFQNWTTGSVCAGSTDTHAWFKIGPDEYRYATIQKGTYASGHDIRESFGLPEFHDATWMSVEVKPLRDVLKQAIAASPTRAVLLEFGLMQVNVKSGNDVGSFQHQVEGRPGLPGGGASMEAPTILIDGKFLDEALKQATTPRVRLCYNTEGKSLRVESGAMLAALWHRVG